MVRNKGGNADTEIHVIAIAQFFGRSLGHQIANRRIFFRRGAARNGSKLDAFFVFRTLNDTVDKNAGRVNLIGIEFTDFEQLFDFGHGYFSAGRNHRIEIARGFAIDQIAGLVALPRFHDRDIRANRFFQHIFLAVEIVRVFVFSKLGAECGARIEAGNSRAARAKFFGECALWHQLQIEFMRQYLPLKLLVLTDVGGDHFFYLSRFQ